MGRPAVKLMLTTVLASVMLLAAAGTASAHVQRDVGAYKFTVGWSMEPAYSGQLNSVQLILATLKSGKPYTTLTDTLHVVVRYGQQSVSYALTPTFDPDTGLGTPGDYRAWFFPTAPGDYTFQFVGAIGSQKVDESFSSGPTTFSPVQDPAVAQFPMRAPTNTQLSERLDAQMTRTATADQFTSARMLAIIGIVVGVGGMAVGTIALLRRRA